MSEEEPASEREVASLRLLVLLLYSRLQSMACNLPQQESRSRVSCLTLPYICGDYNSPVCGFKMMRVAPSQLQGVSFKRLCYCSLLLTTKWKLLAGKLGVQSINPHTGTVYFYLFVSWSYECLASIINSFNVLILFLFFKRQDGRFRSC